MLTKASTPEDWSGPWMIEGDYQSVLWVVVVATRLPVMEFLWLRRQDSTTADELNWWNLEDEEEGLRGSPWCNLLSLSLF